ncbi:sensor histidine kinase [Taibaiella koreensis]|uniref:sensor histidine kinase n=1 Tax=Taibaiella koreensis TaxID=1268548 RepID=UPI0013C2EF13|nr:ATP-binding protein [Taibaiella koreensis]
MNDIIVLLLSGCLLMLILLLLASWRRRQKELRDRKLEAPWKSEQHYEQVLLRSRLEVQEQALHHVNNEIKDNIGQVLSGVQMKLAALSERMGVNQEADTFSEVVSGMGKSISDLRKLGTLLDPPTIEKIGLLDAIEKELAFVSLIYNLQCTFTYSEHLPGLNVEQDLLLFRILQESVINVHKHAAATAVNIHISYAGGILSLLIADNGRGMDYETSFGRGSGLRHIQERIRLLDGSFDIISQPGEGTTLVLTCKLKHE